MDKIMYKSLITRIAEALDIREDEVTNSTEYSKIMKAAEEWCDDAVQFAYENSDDYTSWEDAMEGFYFNCFFGDE